MGQGADKQLHAAMAALAAGLLCQEVPPPVEHTDLMVALALDIHSRQAHALKDLQASAASRARHEALESSLAAEMAKDSTAKELNRSWCWLSRADLRQKLVDFGARNPDEMVKFWFSQQAALDAWLRAYHGTALVFP